MTDHAEAAQAIEDMLIGSGAADFRALEHKIARFCPFEAIGMVRQEIRHAHFLSFILDPNRAHPFQDDLLKLFVQEVIAQAQEGQIAVQALSVHCADYNSALVYRERSNIDFLVEIPPGAHRGSAKGLVVTVELKVDAVESAHQLGSYYDHIKAEYPADQWDRAFVFLTLDASAPSEANSDTWIPVGLLDVIERFDSEVDARTYAGGAVDLYRNYSAMVRRHLVTDEDLALLAKSIWAKHKDALEALIAHRPDLGSDIFAWLRENSDQICQEVSERTPFKLVPDTFGTSILRFSIENWQDLPGFVSEERPWVESGSLVLIELASWSQGRLRMSLVMGPGDQEIREAIYHEVKLAVRNKHISIGRVTKVLGNYKHFSATDVQTKADYAKAETSNETVEELGEKVIKKAVAFLTKTLPIYDEIVAKVLVAPDQTPPKT